MWFFIIDKSFALFPLLNNLFCVDNVRRIYILINWLGLKGLMVLNNYRIYSCTSRTRVKSNPIFEAKNTTFLEKV